jgi:pilus assembly protein Flp/PilA
MTECLRYSAILQQMTKPPTLDMLRRRPMLLRKLIRNEKGATAIEYGLIAALVAIAAIVGMTALGSKLNSQFTYVSGKMRTS